MKSIIKLRSTSIAIALMNSIFNADEKPTTAASRSNRVPDRSHNQPQKRKDIERACARIREQYQRINRDARAIGHSFTSKAPA